MTTFTITTAVNGSSLSRLGSVAALPWTRATTTATVTQAAHGMVTGDLYNVTVTSDAAAVTLGIKSVTVLTASTYSFACLNAGAASGTVTANAIDDYNINGGTLTIDTHTRYGLGSNTSAALGDIAMSATLGGTVEFNSTLVRLIPYNTGTGNVPAPTQSWRHGVLQRRARDANRKSNRRSQWESGCRAHRWLHRNEAPQRPFRKMKKLLGDLSALSSRTHTAERRIHDRAVERDGEVSTRLDELRPTAMFDDGVAQEYQKLVMERGKLAHVIGVARQRLKQAGHHGVLAKSHDEKLRVFMTREDGVQQHYLVTADHLMDPALAVPAFKADVGTDYHKVAKILAARNLPLEYQKLTEAECVALHFWSQDSNRDAWYRQINNALRSVDGIDRLKPLIHLVIKALNKLPRAIGPAYRVINESNLPAGFIDAHQTGKEVLYHGFTGCSTDTNATLRGNIIQTIRVQYGRNISAVSDKPWQKEVLIPPRGHFVVNGLKLSKSKERKWEIKLKETVDGDRSVSREQISGQF